MTTVSLVFHDEDDTPKVDACAFTDLAFLDGANCVFIPSPKLTPREFRQLETQLPLGPGRTLDIGFIPVGETNRFADLYRYFPAFVAVETLG